MSIECNESGNVVINRGYMIGKRYLIVSKLGEGGCGTVYKVIDTKSKEKLALKAEANCIEGGSVLKLEAKILAKLRNKPHFPQIAHSAKREKFSYIVMTLLGDSLSYLLRLHGSRINSIGTQVRIGINVLHAIKLLHDNSHALHGKTASIAFNDMESQKTEIAKSGVIHRDIKPANLAMGHSESHESHIVHILDFGLAREYVLENEDGTKCIRRPREDCLFRGTSRYCSVTAHEKGEQGRVDDLWSVAYFLAEMRAALPWARIRDKTAVHACKKACSQRELFFNSPDKMVKFTEHLCTLSYFDRPNYRLLYDILAEIMRDYNVNFDDLYDWEEEKTDGKDKGVKGKKDIALPSAEVTKGEKEQKSSASNQTTTETKEAETVEQQKKSAELAKTQREDEAEQQAINSSETQDDPDTWGDFPPEDFSINPLGF